MLKKVTLFSELDNEFNYHDSFKYRPPTTRTYRDAVDTLHITGITATHLTKCICQLVHDTTGIGVNWTGISFVQKPVVISRMRVNAFCIRVV